MVAITIAILAIGLTIAAFIGSMGGGEAFGAFLARGTLLLAVVVHFDWRLRQIRDRNGKAEPSVYCPKCESANDRASTRCSNCGHALT